MARYVPVIDWRPVETRVHVSDVPTIVETLGGEKLYGDEPTAPVRELLQNAMDAIQARRRLQGRSSDWGRIVVELSEHPDGVWLSVEDTGVGMSEAVLLGPLLDFGSSFWRSSEIAEEYPGLAARGMNAIGRFGIGFFSIFMLGDYVRVTTRRYDRAEGDALVLQFRAGIASRPILHAAAPGTAPLDGGTRVEVRLRHDPRLKKGIRLVSKKSGPKESRLDPHMGFDFFRGPRLQSHFPSLARLLARLAPASDVSIEAIEFGGRTLAVSASDWLRISPRKLADRVCPEGAQDAAQKTTETFIRPIATQGGKVLGRAALYPSMFRMRYTGALVVGGLRVTGIPHLLGVVSGEVNTAARDKGRVVVPAHTISEWATEQAKLISASDLDARHKALCAEFALESGGLIFGLPIARWGGAWLNSDDLRRLLACEAEVALFVGEVEYDEDPVPKPIFDEYFEPSDDIIFVPQLDFGQRSCLRHLILQIIEQEWGGYEEEEDDRTVGCADYEDITRSVDVFRRPEAGTE